MGLLGVLDSSAAPEGQKHRQRQNNDFLWNGVRAAAFKFRGSLEIAGIVPSSSSSALSSEFFQP